LDNGVILPRFDPSGNRQEAESDGVRCFNDHETDESIPAAVLPPSKQTDWKRAGLPCYTLLRDFCHNLELAMPPTTDVACWWCCHRFGTSPVGIPVSVKEETQGGRRQGGPTNGGPTIVYRVLGCFCGYACALAWAIQSREYHRCIPLLKQMRRETCNREESAADLGLLAPAPAREMLSMFGGPFDIEQFRRVSSEGLRYRVVPSANILPTKMLVEDVDQAEYESTSVLQELKRRGAAAKQRRSVVKAIFEDGDAKSNGDR
jgi:hypothetical protein